MKAETLQIRFMPVTHDDLPLLLAWLREPHLAQWWGEAEAELAMIAEMVDGTDPTRPFLFHVNGEPLGYIQAWDVGEQQAIDWPEKPDWLALLPPDMTGIDLSIGNGDRIGKGIGTQVLKEFVEMLRAEGKTRFLIDPDPVNLRAVRAYEKAGFRPIPELAGKTGDSLLMQLEFTKDGTAE